MDQGVSSPSMKSLLGAVEADRLGVRGEAPEAEVELEGLLDRALRERAGGADLRADEHGEGVRRRVGIDGHGGLDLAEAVGDRGGRVGGEQQGIVEPVGDVRLVAGRAAHAHLGDGHLELDRTQEGDDPGELLGGRARGEADDVRARRAGVDDQAGERDVVEGVRLLRDCRVDAARGDEGVDEVEVGGRRAVELGDAAVRVEGDGGLGIVRRGERDEPRLVVPLGEAVEVDRPLVERLEAAEAGGAVLPGPPRPVAPVPASSASGVMVSPSTRCSPCR